MPESLAVLEGVMSFVYAHVGAIDRVLELPERGADIRYLGLATMTPIWEPHAAPMRKTERFKTLVRKLGLVDYWPLRELARPLPPSGGQRFRVLLALLSLDRRGREAWARF